jgi:hypothetical protein
MTDTTILLMACLAVIGLMARLIYAASRGRSSTLTEVCEIRRDLDRLLAGSRSIEDTLERHRRVLYDAHKKIHEAVTKGLEKPTR